MSLLLVILSLAGCRPAPEPDPLATFQLALDALSGQTVVAYRSPDGETLNVTKNGLVQGSVPLRGQQVRIVRAGGVLYLRAPSAFWQARGLADDRAGEYGARWVRADANVLTFDPWLVLAPAALARSLRAGLPSAAKPVKTASPDGRPLFDVNGFRVTAAPPYRVVSVVPALLGPSWPGGGPVVVDGLAGDGVAALRSSLDTAAADLAQPFVAGAAVAVTVTANDLSCGTDGSCTDVVRVQHRLTGDAPNVAVRLVLNASMSSADLGARSCAQEAVVAMNEPARLSCAVKFDLPRAAGSTRVVARPAVTAEPVAMVDVAELRREVAAELGQ